LDQSRDKSEQTAGLDQLASACINQARGLLGAPNGTSRSINKLVQATLIDPGDPEALILLAGATSKAAASPAQYAVALKFGGRAVVLGPYDAAAWLYVGMIHNNMSRKDLALPVLMKAHALDTSLFKAARMAATIALELGREDVARDYAVKVLGMAPNDEEMLAIRMETKPARSTARRARLGDRYPEALSDIADFPAAIADHLFEKTEFPRILRPNSRIFAAGSCFATNIASELLRRGYETVANNFGEAINSTLANRAYFNWMTAEEPTLSEITNVVSVTQREAARAAFMASDVIVLTVGVAPVFLDRETGALRLPKDEAAGVRRLLRECEFRTLSVAENKENLLHILSRIREYCPNATVFLTLSPVPLTVTFEYDSAITADCVSKPVLRAAIDEVMRERVPNVCYWPAFEAVRWIGAYHGDVYGEDDGSTRHVSDRVVRGITARFVERIKISS
jgi:tetratricopeptide (TPR) repeat protein